MKTNYLNTLVTIILCTFSSIVFSQDPVLGCMNDSAMNYDPLATEDNGNCFYSGDINNDGIISAIDVVHMLGLYGTSCTLCSADFNQDQFISAFDLSQLLGIYGVTLNN